MFAPSRAAFFAISKPIPRLAPVMNKVLPANFLNYTKLIDFKGQFFEN
jgi:hypothetical protein